MIPILYEKNETAFSSNGVGRLSDATSCIVSRRINDFYTLELTCPANGNHADEIEPGMLILATPSDAENAQPFRIHEIDKSLDGFFTVYANHISYDLSGYPIEPFSAGSASAAIAELENSAVVSSGFTFSTDLSVSATYTLEAPTSIRAVMGGDESIQSTYGGEWAFDFYNVQLLSALGTDTGVSIRYGKNLTELVAVGSNEEDYTAAIAYYLNNGTYVVSAVQYLDQSAVPQRIMIIDATEKFGSTPSVADLDTEASDALATIAGVTQSITVSFAPIWQSDEYKGIAPVEQVGLGDYVTVVYDDYDVKAKMEVVQTDYNVLLDRFEAVELGAVRSTLADTLAGIVTGVKATSSGGGGSTVTYAISASGSTITLTGSNGLSSTATVTGQYAGSPSSGGNANKTNAILFGTVDNTSTSTKFTATVSGLTALEDGTTVMLKNGVVTSASGFTLNVNSLGALPVYTNLAAATRDTTIFNINYTMMFIYDSTRVSGGAWICFRGYDSNSNTIGYQLRTHNAARPAYEKGYRYRIWFSSPDGQSWVPANTSTSTNATTARTANTTPIDPFGPIAYYSYNTTTAAAANLTASYTWFQYPFAIGYSFTDSLSLTAYDPVYVKCLPQTDGSAIMQGTTQALPNTADGYIYIFLGVAYSTTNIELWLYHPVYYHDGSGIRLWTGATGTTPLTGDTSGITPAQVKTALAAGRTICIATTGALDGNLMDFIFTSFNGATDMNGGSTIDVVTSQSIIYYNSNYNLLELQGDVNAGTWQLNSTTL